MTRWLITRHPSARAWVEHVGITYDRFLEHLDTRKVMTGDIVIGSLPVHLAAEVCSHGARYLHLTLTLDREGRGLELDEEAMMRFGARLQEYVITQPGSPLEAHQ